MAAYDRIIIGEWFWMKSTHTLSLSSKCTHKIHHFHSFIENFKAHTGRPADWRTDRGSKTKYAMVGKAKGKGIENHKKYGIIQKHIVCYGRTEQFSYTHTDEWEHWTHYTLHMMFQRKRMYFEFSFSCFFFFFTFDSCRWSADNWVYG